MVDGYTEEKDLSIMSKLRITTDSLAELAKHLETMLTERAIDRFGWMFLHDLILAEEGRTPRPIQDYEIESMLPKDRYRCGKDHGDGVIFVIKKILPEKPYTEDSER